MDARSDVTCVVNGILADLAKETLRDRSGNTIFLRSQSFAVLRYFLDNANRVVTKDELMQAVWPGIAVTDDSLVQCIHEIRRALNDEDHALLKTLPRRGYRFSMPTTTAEAPNDVSPAVVPPKSARPALARGTIAAFAALIVLIGAGLVWLWAGSGTRELPADGPPVVAVLPFDNLGDDPSQAYFADGITEDLITDLSKISGIFVIARNSVWPYKGKPATAGQVAKDLGARYVLEGSVRRDGDQVRINAQLVDTVTDHHLWADRYDGKLSDVFKLQDQVIAKIVSGLAVELTKEEAAATVEVETANPEAYDALLLGLEHLHRDTEDETLKAISLFEQAVKLDPEYSRAYAAIAAAQLRIALTNWYTTSGAGMDRAYAGMRENLAKALEKPTSLAYTTAAVWAHEIGRYEDALASVEKAQALAPNDPDVLVSKAVLLNATGKAAEAEAELRRAMRVDPGFAPATLRALSMALHHQEKYQAAIDVVHRIKAQGSETTYDYVTLVSSLGQLGRTDGVKEGIDGFNALALPAAFDSMTVQEAQWYWNGDLFDYYRPYVDKMVEGLRKAGVPEGAGMDIPLDKYKGLIKRIGEGEFDVDGATEINAVAAKALRDRGVQFVDLRAPLDYANGHIPGAVNLSLVTALSKETLAKVAGPDDEVVFYCHTKYCSVSAYASAKAIVWGYKRVYRFAGGFPEWKDAGYPIEVAPKK